MHNDTAFSDHSSHRYRSWFGLMEDSAAETAVSAVRDVLNNSLLAGGNDPFLFGTIICDPQSRVVYANSVAYALVQARLGLVIRHQTLSADIACGEDGKKFAASIRAVCLGANANMVLSQRDSPTLIIRMRPLAAEFGDQSVAMLAVRNLNAEDDFSADDLMTMFRLSPAQASLAIGLYNGKSFETIAVERNVKVSTLRTHFIEVLHRTGSKSLRDLIRRLGMIPPLR